jgi:hypothetical protein
LLGQFSFALGVPLPVVELADQSTNSSECGCCPVDRAAKQCCCQTSAPRPEKQRSCCDKKQAVSAIPAQPRAESSTVKLKWHGGIFQQKCQGPLGSSTTNAGVLAVCPEPPAIWVFDVAGGDWLSVAVVEFAIPSFDQLTPPPRSPA